MPKEYVGHLPASDPLYPYLREHILPEAGVDGHHADFRVFSMKRAKVYLYEEKHSRTQVVGKFFANGKHSVAESIERMQREFDNLQLLRGYGLDGYPHHVVRPLGANDSLNSMVVEEYCGGVSLCEIIDGAIYQKRRQQLFAKLAALAYFLATLHNRTANGHSWDFAEDFH